MATEDHVSVAIDELRESLKSNPNDPAVQFNLGELLWIRGDKKNAVEHLMLAAKLNPLNAAAFRYLGDYYAHISPEPQRSLKCYQRAVTLNPDDLEAGEAICNLLDEAGKESLELAICHEASEKSPRAFWAFRRMGYLQAHQRKWSEAIQSIQHAIRGFASCADLWETLGLAYQRMGMFSAALKSYARTLELDSLRIFALVESGNISLMLGSFRKGIEQFQQALNISPSNVSAHYGLASALLGFAKECANSGALKWGASLLEEASDVALRGTSLASNFSCMWKLHGDIQLMYARCFPWMEEAWLNHADDIAFKSSISSWKETCFSAARNACHSYQHALRMTPWLASTYTDVAIASFLSSSFKESPKQELNVWSVAEKMSLGALLLEGHNQEFWVALGCLSDLIALRQHAFIRALQLDVSLAVAWAFLGKLYRCEGEKQLAMQAFDRARSIDPSLPLPWAGMSADAGFRKLDPNEAYECCLRAVQIFPLAEFQVGLAKLALSSTYLSSSEVFGAIQQALQRVPQYPESHNLAGLVCESRSDYESAITSYRLARCALVSFADESSESHLLDISINLARSLCMAGKVSDAVEECEYLRQKGQLDSEGLQIYALCLWRLGQNDMALSMTRSLASGILSMEENLAATTISLVCRLLYYISGQESAITSILKMPKELFHSSKLSFVVSAIHVLDANNRLQPIVSMSRLYIKDNEDIITMHTLITLGKLLKNGNQESLGMQKGVDHLRKALHMFPNNTSLRNLMSYLLLLSKERRDLYLTTRCSPMHFSDHQKDDILKHACEIFGAANVACYVVGSCKMKYPFAICRHQGSSGSGVVQVMQKYLHQEPWNFSARYLLTLNFFQKAREEGFPHHICRVLERLTTVALSNDFCSSKDESSQYRKFQLLLCAAETNLQQGYHSECLRIASSTLGSSVKKEYIFFAHLLLCRGHAAENDIISMSKEYNRCLELKTDLHIGWICLKLIESRYGLQDNTNMLASSYENCSKDTSLSWNIWMALFNMVHGLIAIGASDFVAAEEFLMQACSIADSESHLFLCHGAISMELAKQKCESQYISRAIRSLKKAKDASANNLPIISFLLAQAEASLGSKAKWEMNLRNEWTSWPPEMKPAELLFQMHLLSRNSKDGFAPYSSSYSESSHRWILKAIHTDPSCFRYWKFLLKELM
ncbi:tetratricopeptide repeat protein SKI3 [Andrographis paniculata]|uniref:tetratricopeptide repeat protein SKI3 n=1 Tax=Andrographis paniculata TaxID=175694 RepID=UPI0021E84022|nr:tetratricopeptide repeat protein SKI3 [Andrographis paniculata]